mmetsp:Transcript_131220/g.245554  ORF Transcript_131220/g.245554 Transcript_131220/m.245554 type:complete len:242 (-) Transcript_131220:88-813(-)
MKQLSPALWAVLCWGVELAWGQATAPTTQRAPRLRARRSLSALQQEPPEGPSQEPLTFQCVKWRKSATCDPSGPRDCGNDKDCNLIIDGTEAGYCECTNYVHTSAVPCGHAALNCTTECQKLVPLHREVFGADYKPEEDEEGLMGDDAGAQANVGYNEAEMYGKQAKLAVAKAVSANKKMLTEASDMINKMMDLKPWNDIDELGKQAETAGKRARELAKLARPFIYTQENATGFPRRRIHL